MHGGGHVQQGACVVGGGWQGGHAWQSGMCGGRHAWQGSCVAGVVCGRGLAWQGTCMVGGMHGRGVCMAAETATAVDSMHPTGMLSCFKVSLPFCPSL